MNEGIERLLLKPPSSAHCKEKRDGDGSSQYSQAYFDRELEELRTMPKTGMVDGNRPPYTFSTGAVYAGQWKV